MAPTSKITKADVVARMRFAGIRPAVIYAYERTGLLVDEASYKKLSPHDRREYDAAFDEYEARQKRAAKRNV